MNKKLKKWIAIKTVRKLIGVSLFVSQVLVVFYLINTRIIPIKYIGLYIIIATLIVWYITSLWFKTKLSLKKEITLRVASVLIIILNIFIISICTTTLSFINNIQASNITSEEYSVIAKKDRHIDINATNKQNMGILNTDIHNDLVKAALKGKVNAEYKDYDDLTSLTTALNNNSVDLAVIKSSQVQLLKENYNSFYISTETLMTFKIKYKTSVETNNTDVTKPFVIYISGIDTYGSISTVSRSDVNIIVVVNPKTHEILLVTTPRDYYVQLHGTTGIRDKLTHAGIYGIDMSIKTLQDLYATNIDYYLRVNFSSLTEIVDALGGVEVNSDYDFSAGGYHYDAGINQLNGAQALAFSRERYSFESGDRTRGENQERVIEAIIAKMSNPSNLLNYQKILSSLTNASQTSMSSDSISSLINNQLNGMDKWLTKSISVTGTDSHNFTYSMGGISLYVMEPDPVSLEYAKNAINQYKQYK